MTGNNDLVKYFGHLENHTTDAAVGNAVLTVGKCFAATFFSATEVVTLYVFHEPSLLSSLQDRKLTDVILEALVVKEVGGTNFRQSIYPSHSNYYPMSKIL